MNFSIRFITILVVLVLSIMVHSCHSDKNKVNENYFKELKKKIEYREAISDSLLLSAYTDDGIILNLPFTVQSDKIVVFKFSDNDCDKCIDTILNLLKTNSLGQGIPIEIWNQVDGAKSIYSYKPWYDNIKGIRFRIIHNELDMLSSNQNGKPFLFIFDGKTNCISQIIFPELNKLPTIYNYFNIINRKYFQGKN